ncbi:MAG: AMP-binding protein [Chloroflexi bacterium]|nr:AMP-binding protein [Chloroflexota bacterium]
MNHAASLAFGEADLLTSVPVRFQQVLDHLPPEHLAYVSPDEVLTYHELAAASRGLAAALAAMLDSPAPRSAQKAVALLLPHSAATLVGIMGVLEAGHFYLPLDFIMGEATLRQILLDCPPQAMVTTTALRERLRSILPAGQNPPVLCIDTIPPSQARLPALPPDDGPMYASVQYTSGSTGRPRGVIRTHAANLYASYLAGCDLGFTSGDRVSNLRSYAHGSSTQAIFGGLLNGATLHTLPMQEIAPSTFYQWIADSEITVLHVSLGVLHGLAELAGTHRPLTTLRVIVTGGETMRRSDVERLYPLLPASCKFVTRLVSTEAGDYARFVIEAGKPWSGNQIPAGYVPPGCQVLIVDENNQPAAADQPGEIAVRSRFLSAGYWQRPEATAAKFLPDPDDSQQRLFLTGDMGRMSADGLLEHLGRKDFMVKIRGYRVQPEEVEAALTNLANIAEAAVIARETRAGEKQLIAYCAAVAYPPPTASALRDALLTRLPDYMVPARFVVLEKLPRNAIGKVDRAALPPPDAARPELRTSFVAPHNELEQQIADIWAELLELEEMGVDDNFFELGGDSLSAMRMLLAVEQSLGDHVPTEFFGQPTVAYLARLISGETSTENASRHPTVLRSSGPIVRRAGRFTPHNVLRHLTQVGPLWRGRGLPYGLGVQMQRLWIRLPLIRQRLQQRAAVLQEWLALVGRDDPSGREMELSLLANTWRGWREACVQQPETFAQWVTVNGVDKLDVLLADGRPIILVATHTAIRGGAMKMAIRQRSDRNIWTLGYCSTGQVDAVARVVRARNTLMQGGMVVVTEDGAQGTKGVEIPIYDRPWLFRSGGAELALDTDAALLPVFCTLAHSGHVAVEFLEPLTSAHSARQGQVEDLTRQYAALLEARWPSLLSNMKWGKLQQMLDYAVRRAER